MRTIQVRVVCDRCEKVDFYDMPIAIMTNMVSIAYDMRSHLGPLGWKMSNDKCWCSIECEMETDVAEQKKDMVKPVVAKLSGEDDMLSWKQWNDYCNTRSER